MAPRLRHRAVVILAIAIGLTIWLSVLGLLMPAEASEGISLFHTRSGSFLAILVALAAATLTATIGVLVAAAGNPLGGTFCLGAVLAYVGWRGGSMAGWLRQADIPGAYALLMIEILVWVLPLVALIFASDRFRNPIRQRIRLFAWDPTPQPPLVRVRLDSLYAGLLATAAAALVGYLLIQSAERSQVIWSLVVAFLLAGLIAQLAFPRAGAVGILLSPVLLGFLTYALTLVFYNTRSQLLASWFASDIVGLALALPIYFLGAGLAGACLGIGWAQNILLSNRTHEQLAAAQ